MAFCFAEVYDIGADSEDDIGHISSAVRALDVEGWGWGPEPGHPWLWPAFQVIMLHGTKGASRMLVNEHAGSSSFGNLSFEGHHVPHGRALSMMCPPPVAQPCSSFCHAATQRRSMISQPRLPPVAMQRRVSRPPARPGKANALREHQCSSWGRPKTKLTLGMSRHLRTLLITILRILAAQHSSQDWDSHLAQLREAGRQPGERRDTHTHTHTHDQSKYNKMIEIH